jgi:hypothetical protein
MKGQRTKRENAYGSPATIEPVIPARIVIGVTGHREIDMRPKLIADIRFALECIRQMLPPLSGTSFYFTVLSPLAEGADRLIVREILALPGSSLEVILPLPGDDYVSDFKAAGSRTEFEAILAQAGRVRQLRYEGNRNEAYEQVGRYVVDHCDVLIAVWDGDRAAGQGGTGDIARYARERNCPLAWIHATGEQEVTFETGRGLDEGAIRDLDMYNAEHVDEVKLGEQAHKGFETLAENMEQTGLPSDRLQPGFFTYLLYHHLRADILASYYQHLYHRSGNLVYVLATAAVFLAAFQVLFLPEQSWILLFEVLFMICALAIVRVSRQRKWHTKWIDYRFLAERFRSAPFIAISGMDMITLRPPRHLSLAYSPNDWMVLAFSSVWDRRPRPQGPDSMSVHKIRDFLQKYWIEDQIRYHSHTSKKYFGQQQRMSRASTCLFGLTLLAALLHIVGVGHHILGNGLALMAIVLPAIGASISAIRIHRDYLRNSMRSSEMARHLTELGERTIQVQDRQSLLQIITETEQTMLHENEDWRVVVRFNIPELPV